MVLRQRGATTPPQVERPACRAEALSKVHGRRDTAVHALRDVTLELPARAFTAIMGPSGSGKSTLLHCLAALDSPTSGRVFLGDVELTSLSRRQQAIVRRDRIGFVFQAFNLVPTLDALENITLPQLLAGRRPDEEWLDHVIDRIGLGDRLHHRPSELSGGQQQRIALARALAGRPDVIFADEPTGNLDTAASADMLTLLRNAVDQFAQTVVTVTHDPAIADYADQILHFADGTVIDRVEPHLGPAPSNHAWTTSSTPNDDQRQGGDATLTADASRADWHDTMRSRRRRDHNGATPGRPMVGSDDEVEVARQERWLQRIREQFGTEHGTDEFDQDFEYQSTPAPPPFEMTRDPARPPSPAGAQPDDAAPHLPEPSAAPDTARQASSWGHDARQDPNHVAAAYRPADDPPTAHGSANDRVPTDDAADRHVASTRSTNGYGRAGRNGGSVNGYGDGHGPGAANGFDATYVNGAARRDGGSNGIANAHQEDDPPRNSHPPASRRARDNNDVRNHGAANGEPQDPAPEYDLGNGRWHLDRQLHSNGARLHTAPPAEDERTDRDVHDAANEQTARESTQAPVDWLPPERSWRRTEDSSPDGPAAVAPWSRPMPADSTARDDDQSTRRDPITHEAAPSAAIRTTGGGTGSERRTSAPPPEPASEHTLSDTGRWRLGGHTHRDDIRPDSTRRDDAGRDDTPRRDPWSDVWDTAGADQIWTPQAAVANGAPLAERDDQPNPHDQPELRDHRSQNDLRDATGAASPLPPALASLRSTRRPDDPGDTLDALQSLQDQLDRLTKPRHGSGRGGSSEASPR